MIFGLKKLSISVLERKKDIPGLIRTFGRGDLKTRQEVAAALVRIGQDTIRYQLVYKLDSTKDRERQAIFELISTIGPRLEDEKAIEKIVAYLSSSEPDLREMAIAILENNSWKANNNQDLARYYIAKKLWDACIALGEDSIIPLSEAFNNKDFSTRETILTKLKDMGDTPVKTLLNRYKELDYSWPTNNNKWEQQKEIANTLSQLGLIAIMPLSDFIDKNTNGSDTTSAHKREMLKNALKLLLIKYGPDLQQSDKSKIAIPFIDDLGRSAYEKYGNDISILTITSGPEEVNRLISLLTCNQFDTRKLAAQVLIELYYTGNLDEQIKKLIRDQKQIIETPILYDNDPDNYHSVVAGIGLRFRD